MLGTSQTQISLSFYLSISLSSYPAGDDLVALVHVRYTRLLRRDGGLLALPAQRRPRQVRRAVHHPDAAGVVHRALTLATTLTLNPNSEP